MLAMYSSISCSFRRRVVSTLSLSHILEKCAYSVSRALASFVLAVMAPCLMCPGSLRTRLFSACQRPPVTLMSAREWTRLGAMDATLQAIIPPIECPKMCAFRQPSKSMSASASRAMMAVEYALRSCGCELAPTPLLSNEQQMTSPSDGGS